jgi:hypothetical protein
MSQNQSNSALTVDLEIRFNARVLTLRLGNLLKWLVPLAIAAIKLAAYLHR